MTRRLLGMLLGMAGLLVGGGAALAGSGSQLQINPNHAGHKKAGVDCLTCHEGIFDQTALGQPGAFPKEKVCLGCHQKEKDAGNCGMCHLQAKPGTFVTKPSQLIMNHAKHLEKDERCEVCHLVLPAKEQLDKPVPPMSTCLGCHATQADAGVADAGIAGAGFHQRQFDNGQCYACHVDLTHYPLKPSTVFSHQGNFTRNHPPIARSTSASCDTCHEQNWCSDCHASKTRPMKPDVLYPERVDRNFIHRGDYITRHSIEARAGQATCQKCHAVSFCTDCHRQQRLTSDSNNPLNPHPSGWLTPGSPLFHGTEARKDIVSCAACHDQGAASNCVTCHRVGAPGGNPHPSSFLSKHSTSEIPGQPMCQSCHP